MSGSVALVFTSAGATRTIQLNDATSASFTINPTLDLAATYSSHINSVTGGGSTIPDGTYSVSMSYRDLTTTLFNSSTETDVVIDTSTASPTLTSPATSSTFTITVPIQFTRPESAFSGSQSLTFSNLDNTVVLT